MPLKPLLVLVVCAPLAYPQISSLPPKETLYYTIDWRLFTAGKAKLEFTASPASKPEAQISLHLESVGFVSKLFKVEDDYNSTLNAGLCAQTSYMTAHEAGRERETRITFDGESKKASYLERDRAKNSVLHQQETDIPPCVHDVAGGLYFIRTLNLEPGQTAQVFVDAYDRKELEGTIDSIQAGTGARFSVIPPENATGNFVKVVQRVPVKIKLKDDTNADEKQLLSPGMSVEVKVRVRD